MTEDIEFSSDEEEFKKYKQKRIQEMKITPSIITITNEDKLIEKTKQETMIVHFYKENFRRCKIMDEKLNKIYKKFPFINFYRVEAEKCMLVATKLGIRVLPFLGFFKNGFFVDSLIGFEGINVDDVGGDDLVMFINKSNIMK